MLLNGQVQYGLNLFNGREELLLGSDYKLTVPKTEGTIHGRNESMDQIEELGAYVQSTTMVTEDVTLTLALRGDYNNLYEKLQVSPRAGILFKITSGHNFRVAVNHAYGAPVLNPNFLDLRVQDDPISGPFSLAIQGQGAHQGFTFNQFRENQLIRYLIPDLGDLQQPANPSFFGQHVPLDRLPVHPVFEAFAADLTNALLNGQTLPAPLNGLSLSDRERFAQLINQLTPYVQGVTAGSLGVPAPMKLDFVPLLAQLTLPHLSKQKPVPLNSATMASSGKNLFFLQMRISPGKKTS